MPKIIIEFSEDEKESALIAIHAGKYHFFINDIQEKLRSEFKHKEEPCSLKEFRDWFYEELKDIPLDLL